MWNKIFYHLRRKIISEIAVSAEKLTTKLQASFYCVFIFSLRRLCFHRCLSVNEGGFGLCPGGVSVWGSLSGGSLSRGVPVQGGLCLGGLCPWGVSVQGGLCQGDPPYCKERAVRILLECIFVVYCISYCLYPFHNKFNLLRPPFTNYIYGPWMLRIRFPK